ncbi:MAG: peptide deformylase [Acidobacteria bacterium 13_1_20CM_2_55_15]|nr:MAG: peptide deformylase [Acidobacteria bacterium 13_1_20CM_2_55_15]
MSILKVSRLGHPVLRMQSQGVTKEALSSPAIQTLIDNMIETMIEYSGVGLAAPQVHYSLTIAVIESHGPRGDIPLTVLVNPDVTVLDEELLEDWEGCLSIPDLRGRVPRWGKLRVDGLDRHGDRLEFTAEGFAARVVQHEFDHLMGKVYLDRMRDFKTLTHVSEFQRYWLPEQTPSPSPSSQQSDRQE